MNWAVFKLKIVSGEEYVSNMGLTSTHYYTVETFQ